MLARFFVERPIFAAVLSIVLCLAGLVAMRALPVEQYPTITPVQVTVSASYPGADSRTLADSVASPLEAQINGVDKMLYMTSASSSTGNLTLTVFFALDADPDVAQVQVQNRVNLATPQLPSAVVQQGVSVQKKSSQIMMLVGLYSRDRRYSADYIANYANVHVLDALKRVPGAGQASILGAPDQAMRIWMNPDQMAALGVTTSDLQRAVASQNALYGAGQIGQKPTEGRSELTVPVVTQGPSSDPASYEGIILRGGQGEGAIVRLRDVARVEKGRLAYVIDAKLNGLPATFVAVYQQPGANGLEVSRAVHAALEAMKPQFPDGLDYVVSLDTTDFVRLSIDEVVTTLLEALALVILVVYLFLQSFRATLICSAAVMVALLGTFPAMLALGFSINLLTLFGLVLAIGIVVDDAIVVIENVERNMSHLHLPPREATARAMGEVVSPVIATVLVMAAIFVPAALLPGTTGQLYKQFAITIAISVAISGFVALTLTPALAGLFLRHPAPAQRGPFAWFNRRFDTLTAAFGRAVILVIRRTVPAFALLAVLLVAMVLLFRALPTSFVPNEDQGYVMTAIQMPSGASLDRTGEVADRVDAIYAQLPGVADRTQLTGYSLLDGGLKTNAATFFVTLKPYDQRYASAARARAENARAVLLGLYRRGRAIAQGLVLPVAPPSIPGIGTTGGFEFWLQDTGSGDPARLEQVVEQLVARARQRPELSGLSSTFRASTAQLRADVDREKAALLGVPIQDVYSTIQAQFGGLVASQFNEYSRTWWVVLQSDARYRRTPDDLARLYTRSSQGLMIPLSAVVTTRWVTGPDLLPHFNGFPAAKVNGSAAPGYSSGQAIAAMEAAAREVLPTGFSFAWSGLAFEERRSGSTSAAAFAFGIVIVFLVLAAQYESWTLPGAVMTAVPFGILGALVLNWLRGLENDVYFQIGLLVLIGLGAKNALLRVTFAVDLRRQGRSLMEATIEAGELRLRPIIMTSLAFVLGVLPLAVATGVGANSRHSIGTGIIGGMLGETTLAMLYVPLFFYLFERLTERLRARSRPTAPEPAPSQAAPTASVGADSGEV